MNTSRTSGGCDSTTGIANNKIERTRKMGSFATRYVYEKTINLTGGGGGGFALAYQSSATTTNTSLTTLDSGTLTYGSGNTRVIVALEWINNGSSANTVTGVTIGGVALSQVSGAYVTNGGAFAVSVDVWMSTGPLSGSSGDVQVTYSAPVGFAGSIALYNLVTSTPAPGTPATTFNINAPSLTVSATIPAGGGAIALFVGQNGTAFSSWTNAATDVDVAPGGAHQIYGHATATGTVSVTGTLTGNDGVVLSVVPWGP
jgi:hypothetical protein